VSDFPATASGPLCVCSADRLWFLSHPRFLSLFRFPPPLHQKALAVFHPEFLMYEQTVYKPSLFQNL
jgi:hypothetical protein